MKKVRASGGVTENYIDGLTELAKELNGDAEKLLEEVKRRDDERTVGFRTNKAEALEEYLLSEGYLDRKERLDPEEQWYRIVAAVSEERERGIVDQKDLMRLIERVKSKDTLSP